MGKSSINGPFSMAMLNNQRVLQKQNQKHGPHEVALEIVRFLWRKSLSVHASNWLMVLHLISVFVGLIK